jgi:cytochrome c oxidase cbb3-type subunit III
MIGRLLVGCSLALSSLLIAGCSHAPGAHVADEAEVRPGAVTNFHTLFSQNCSGCHGVQGKHGPAIDLSNPVYQALVDDDTLKMIISTGYEGTLMPAFARSDGGMLTDEQVDAIIKGMRKEWRKPGTLDGQNAPPYLASGTGDAQRGQQVFGTFCASCHGPNGKAGSVTDGTYLALVSDDALRTLVIAGRPDLNAPDWRNNVPGHPMTNQEVTDVVAWLSSQRVKTPGQPYPQPQ